MNHGRQSILCLCLLLFPGLVFAHTIGHGISPFLSGLLHPLFVPAHLISLLAVGLLLGQQEPNRHLVVLILFPVAVVLGLAASDIIVKIKPELVLLAATLLVGLLIAANLKISTFWCAIITGSVGFMIGLDSSPQIPTVNAFLGTGLGIMVVPLLSMEFSDYFRRKVWQRISIRILGSWIAASMFLVLALSAFSAKI